MANPLLGSFYGTSSTSVILQSTNETPLFFTFSKIPFQGFEALPRINKCSRSADNDSMLHCISLVDKNGATHTIEALQVDNISDFVHKIYLSGLKNLFSSQIQQQCNLVATRPVGAIDLLLGAGYTGLHPIDIERAGNIRVLSSVFGPELILVGSDPSLKISGTTSVKNALSISQSVKASINRVSALRVSECLDS